MTENYQPPRNPRLTYLPSQGEIFIHNPQSTEGQLLTADEAITLGMALMETGLHLKANQKKPQPEEK